ncbi:MAG: cell division protein FtsW [Anaerolineae bacterium]|nr:cell division protein FtsW [Anaerolineae bacterium]
MADRTLSPQYIDNEPDTLEAMQRAAERKRRFATTLDLYLVLTVSVLIAIGLMMVWSTTFYWSDPAWALFVQQVRNAGIGAVVMIGFTILDYRVWRRLAVPLMGVLIIVLLGLVTLPGIKEVFGARRAYFDGAVQPSEIATLVVIIYMGTWLASKQTKIRSITYGLLPFALLVGTVAGLILMQPDVDPAALILVTATGMFLLAGADWVQIGIVVLAFVIAGVIAIAQFSYARDRFDAFVSLWRDPIQSNASQAQNAIISFLNGGLTGVGLGESRQKFQYLQAPHTDSIFAVIGEELGLVGCAVVVGLYVTLMLRGFRIARNAPDIYGSLIAAGITISIVVKALFNIAVMASMVPFTGVPLPFISFGGSSLISAMAGIGILLSISRAATKNVAPTRKVNETLVVPGMRGSISRVRQQPLE